VQEPQAIETRTKPVARRRIVLTVLLALVGVLVVATAVGSLPAVCSACHGSQTSAMERDAHASVRCYDCHLENGAWGFPAEKNAEFTQMYPAALRGLGLKSPARATSRASCLECHADVLKGVTSGDGLSIKHRVCAVGPTCDGCHSTVAHGTAVRWSMNPSMEDCVACHKTKGVSAECKTCHTSEPAERRNVKGPWQVTHGKNWRKTHGMGDQSTCGTCHPSNFCARCHRVPVPHGADFGATHGTFAQEDRAACLTCHKSAKAFCDECHGMEMPHPEGFTRRHTTIAKSLSDPRCIVCHVDTDCGTCHSYHVHPGGGQGVPVPWYLTPEELRP
jgi:hypothetical protein